jgi:hypothetical protein
MGFGVDGYGTLDEMLMAAHADLPVNGAPIFGPFAGYEVYLANKWGGYQFYQDPDGQPNYSATINPVFALRIPVEISHKTGLGALSNMNASANYKVNVSLAASTTFLSTVGTATLPTVRVRGFLEAWTLPNPTSRDGLPQATMPPLHGTAQYWSKFQKQIVAPGENTIILPRVGNQIRTLIAIFYDDSVPAVRITTEYADPLRINWDARQLINEARPYRQQAMFERYANVGLDTGVFVYDFSHDNGAHPGGEDDGHLWLRTVQATRLELVGTFTGSGGNLTILTNDVAPVAVQNRFEEDSASGGVPGAGEGFNG